MHVSRMPPAPRAGPTPLSQRPACRRPKGEWFGAGKEAARRFEGAVAMDNNAQCAARAWYTAGSGDSSARRQLLAHACTHEHSKTSFPRHFSRFTHAKLPRTPADLQTCGPLFAAVIVPGALQRACPHILPHANKF